MTWQARPYTVLLAAALVIACFTHKAAAQSEDPLLYGGSGGDGVIADMGDAVSNYDNVAPVYIPPPPSIEPHYELGFRYWWSRGKTSFDVNSDRQDLNDTNPTSHLLYDGLQGNTGEITLRARNDTNYFFKGFFGGGWLSAGSLDDTDEYADTKTRSDIDDNGLIYGTIDIGRRYTVMTRGPEVQFNPLVGFNYWQEEAEAFGCQQISGIGGCGGSDSLSNSAKFMTNNMHWASLRLGAEVQAKFFHRLTLIGDAAVLPVAYLWNDENRYLAPSGPANIEDQGTGWGYQLEGSANLDLSCNWALAAGVRYWYAQTNGTSKLTTQGGQSDLHDFTADRLGVFAALTYKFQSF